MLRLNLKYLFCIYALTVDRPSLDYNLDERIDPNRTATPEKKDTPSPAESGNFLFASIRSAALTIFSNFS